MIVLLAGCHSADGRAVHDPAPSNAASRDAGKAYLIGDTVTVRGTVTRVLGPAAFVLDSPGYGDRSLLVLCEPSRDVVSGKRVEVSGNIQKFDYASYVDQYGLAAQPSAYAEFEGEPFLVTEKAMDLPPSTTAAPETRPPTPATRN
ncbi:hypothetical protein [Actinoplanes sp. NPDC051411]|uniref:hypothetical protein n=1 Tax=Actinoplanes sp. NPDC051411 TaxID=3155522 RepID=UPI00341F753B